MINKVIYMDYQATTPMDPRVTEKITDVMQNNFGNPHSSGHIFGWKALDAVEESREQVAKLINADVKEIIFTSGATESNNIAIRGIADFYKSKKNHIITVATEHKCVIESVRNLKLSGFDITFLPVKKDGLIDLDLLKDTITDKTILVSVMAVNNEIGVIQPLKEIGKICRDKGVFFHTDAAQAFGKIPIDVNEMNIDLMSISGHKIYGPKGIGALYIRRRPRVRISPIIFGGGQERGLRSGTLSPALISGLGLASEIAGKEMQQDAIKVKKYFDKFTNEIVNAFPEIYINGSIENRYYGNMNISFGFIEGESMIMAINDIAVSSGSACTSASLEPSYVLKALGVSEEFAHTSIRFGFGRFTTDEEVEYAIKRIKEEINGLRELSPLWDMFKSGIDISKIQWAGDDHHNQKIQDLQNAENGLDV